MNNLDNTPKKKRSLSRTLVWLGGMITACVACGLLLFTFLFAIVYAQLPDMTSLRTYQPKLPLKIWSAVSCSRSTVRSAGTMSRFRSSRAR